MSRNGSGTYSLPLPAVVTGTTISSTWANTTLDDIATALTGSLAKDGQTVITGSIDFNGNKLILDADADTSITSDSDDRIDIEIGGTDAILLGHDSTNSGAIYRFDGAAVTAQANTSIGRFRVSSTGGALTIPAGTTPIAAGLWVAEPNFTATGTITNATTVYIPDAPTEGTVNTAVLIPSGRVLIGATVPATGTPTLDIVDSDAESIVISNGVADATNKQCYLSIRHRTNSEEPATIVGGSTTATDNIVRIGGGLATNNAATIHSFYTAANNTTTTGTEKVRITNSAFTSPLDFKIGDATAVSDTPTTPLHVADSGTGLGTLESTDAGASVGPILDLYRNSASPANSDAIGQITFAGKDSGGTKTTYGVIRANIIDTTDASEDARIAINTIIAGSTNDRLYIGQGTYTPNATGGDKGADSINASAIYDDGTQILPSSLGSTYSVSMNTAATSFNVTGIPAGTRRLIITGKDLVMSGSGVVFLRIGDSGGLETTGYEYNIGSITGAAASETGGTAASGITFGTFSTGTNSFCMELRAIDSTGLIWVVTGQTHIHNDTSSYFGGHKTLSAELDRFSFLSASFNFDGGTLSWIALAY